MRRASIVFVVALTAAQLSIHAQSPAETARSTFEVATVKPNRSGLPNTNFGLQPGGRFSATNAPLREIIRMAYGVPDLQIVGAPDWIRAERFDIVAKANGNPPVQEVLLMLRTLLADRFRLAVHNEKREVPIYALVLARPDRGLGPRLRPAATDCAAIMAAARNGVPPPSSNRILCGTRVRPGVLAVGGLTMSGIASAFWPLVSRIVVDRTELQGNFDLDLDFAPDSAAGGQGVSNEPPSVSQAASIFTAVQEQLGLKLESTRGPVEVLVIDRVEPPTPD
jgi:bla regulator protein blaR1